MVKDVAINQDDFFDERRNNSIVKTNIVTKYFDAWSMIMSKRNNENSMLYLDLFSGPGVYESGEPSTPILILQKTLEDDTLCKKMNFHFNDKEEQTIKKLKTNAENLPNFDLLKNKPEYASYEVDPTFSSIIERKLKMPTLSFVDPFGYKGLTRELIHTLISNFGSECIFFFNYNRISMAINNQLVDSHMKAIFGEELHEEMKKGIQELKTQEEKVAYVMENLTSSLATGFSQTPVYVLPFQFHFENKKGVSHFVVFVTKHPFAYSLMKDIMSRESNDISKEGVPELQFIPVKHLDMQLSFLNTFDNKSIDFLKEDLLKKFAGKTMETKRIYLKHNINTPFILKNYKEALRQLEAEERVTADRPAKERRKVTINGKKVPSVADKLKFTFPEL